MPELDPQPPQPRPISALRWLLLLTPSVIVISTPLLANAWSRARHQQDEETIGAALGFTLLNFTVAIVLCFVLGFLLEKWRWGIVKEWERPLGYGLLILIVNCFIAFAGCALPGMIF